MSAQEGSAPRMLVITEAQLRQLLESQTVEEWVQSLLEAGGLSPADAQRPRLRETVILEKFDKSVTTEDESRLVPFERIVLTDREVVVAVGREGEGGPCPSR